jgi:alanine racemase
MSESSLRSYAEISLDRIAANYRQLRVAVGPDVQVLAVVKANAYGHGAVEVSRRLVSEGARWLAVASAEEGRELRAAGIHSPRILVMSGFPICDPADLVEYDLTPAVHSLEDLELLEQHAATAGRRISYHLKMDSGMGRLGTRAGAGEILSAVRQASHTTLEGLMTHLASAPDHSSPQTGEQLANFARLRGELAAGGISPRYIHISSSFPVAYGRRAVWGNLVRAGLALYGYCSPVRGNAPPKVVDVRPALNWKARILAVKDVPAGTPIGYGALYRAAGPARIAVVAAGYADGVPHQLSNKGQYIAGGKLAPIRGAVSMDVTTIDITDCPPLKPGDTVTLIGSEGGLTLTADDMAQTAGEISYSILCGISSRVKRVYVSAL